MTVQVNRQCEDCFASRVAAGQKLVTNERLDKRTERKKEYTVPLSPRPGGLFVSCVIGKAYPDAFFGADDRRLKAIRDAWIRAASACFPQIEATRG